MKRNIIVAESRKDVTMLKRDRCYDIVFVAAGPVIDFIPGNLEVTYSLIEYCNSHGLSSAIVYVGKSGSVTSQDKILWLVKGNKMLMKGIRKVLGFVALVKGEKRGGEIFGDITEIWLKKSNKKREVRVAAGCLVWCDVESIKKLENKKIVTNKGCEYVLMFHKSLDWDDNGILDAIRKKYDDGAVMIVCNKSMQTAVPGSKRITLGSRYARNTIEVRQDDLTRFSKSPSVVIQIRDDLDKAPEVGLQVAKLLSSSGLDVKIIAYGERIPQHVPDNVTFIRRPNSKELDRILQECAIFVLPSHVEGWSLAAIRAMSLGAVLVSTRNGGVEEYVIDGWNGILTPKNDPAALTDAVVSLVKNGSAAVVIAERGKETVCQYTTERMGAEFVEAIDLLANKE